MESGGATVNALLKPVQALAAFVIKVVRAASSRRSLVSAIGLALSFLLALGYVAVGGLGVDPTRGTITVRVLLPESGGLLANQDVTVRGIPVGRVTAVNLTRGGIEAVATIDADVRIPEDSPVRVSGLSPAGEQYLDFRPERSGGPILTDGAVLSGSQTSVPVSLPQIIDDSRGALAQVDTDNLKLLFDELRVSPEGPKKLASIFDGTTFLASTLHGVLPETVSLVRNGQVMFGTFADVASGLQRTSVNLQQVLDGMARMDGGFRTLVDRGRDQLSVVDDLIADNRDNMVGLLGNLTTLSQLLYLRIPALENLWRPDHGPLIDRISTIFHDGGMWAITDIYERHSCDYNLPRRPPSQADSPEPYLYTYCENDDPALLVRGARNAPRPPGDDTAGPPPGHDPLATADPTPNYPPYTIPITYAGPSLPTWIPD